MNDLTLAITCHKGSFLMSGWDVWAKIKESKMLDGTYGTQVSLLAGVG